MATTSEGDAKAKSIEAAKLYSSDKYGEAFSAYLDLAKEGYATSQRFVGWLYFRGEGVNKDYDQALLWFKKAAEKHDIEAMFGVGRVYMAKGEYKTAFDWYKRSAGRNYLPSKYWVARFHRDGLVGQKDDTIAFRMFREAATLGHLKSQREYSVMLIKGYAGLFGRLKGILLFGKLIACAIYQGMRDPSDPKAIV